MLWSASPTSLSLPIERATKEKSEIERRNRKQIEERGAYSPEQEACSITSLSPGDKSPSALSRIRHMQHRLEGRTKKGYYSKKTRTERTAYNRPQPTVRMETPLRPVKKLPGHRDLKSRKQRAEVQHHVSARSIVENTKNEGKRPRLPQYKWGGRFSRIGVSTPWQQRNQCWLLARETG